MKVKGIRSSIGKLGGRAAIGSLIVGGAAAGMIGMGSGQAAAAPTSCQSSQGVLDSKVSGNGSCTAASDATSRSTARETTGNGTAYSAAQNGGNAVAINNSQKGAAISSALGGNGQSVTYGPAANAATVARTGGTSYAVAGWGGSAYAGVDGAKCQGGPSFAWDSLTGKVCLSTGGINLQN